MAHNKLSVLPKTAAQLREHDQPVHQWVYQTLCDWILAGAFVPGVSVTLRGIAERLDVSPTPVREAIRRLAAEGALEVQGNRRITVAQMTPLRLRELRYARLALEPELAEMAFKHLNKRHIKDLRSIDSELNQSLASGDVDHYIGCNRRFHFGIYRLADSPVLLPLVKSLWLQFAPFTRIVFGRVGTEYLQDFHADALDALAANDDKKFRRCIANDIREGMDMLYEHASRS